MSGKEIEKKKTKLIGIKCSLEDRENDIILQEIK